MRQLCAIAQPLDHGFIRCGALPRLAFDSLTCVGGCSLCPAWNTRPPAFHFQRLRVMRVLYSSISKRLVFVSAFSPPAAGAHVV
jgi:hypothetical protein